MEEKELGLYFISELNKVIENTIRKKNLDPDSQEAKDLKKELAQEFRAELNEDAIGITFAMLKEGTNLAK